jgi:Rad3-related DNA helicase
MVTRSYTSVMDYCVKPPRPQQRQILSEIESNWNSYDVFVIDAPVATGKSLCAHAIANWAGNSTILTPTNVLLDQYERDFKDIDYLRRKSLYPCNTKYGCSNSKKCGKCLRTNLYNNAKSAFIRGDVSACNYYMYIAMRKHHNYKCSTLIVDECQNLLPTITDFAAKKIWRRNYNYPNNLRTELDILEWMENEGLTKQYKDAVDSIKSGQPEYLFERTTELYRGEEEELIKVRPITIQNYKPIMWPWFIDKIVLMSATISRKDVEELGLGKRRVKYIQVDSPIPPSSRPIVYDPVGNMSYSQQDTNMVKIADKIRYYMTAFKSRGIIHTTYSISRKLRDLLDDDRLIFHDRDNTRTKYREYLNSNNGVLVACGLSEGLDLANDLGRWQLITKVPYPSLADSAVKVKAEQDPDWYKWMTAKTIIQASGRVCRHQKDFGATVLLDNQFANLYNSNRELFPQWFSQALEWRTT